MGGSSRPAVMASALARVTKKPSPQNRDLLSSYGS
jgi:hypothetical protein